MGIASISGVALVPGVSRNRRLYTPELIASAAKRMQERLKDPNGLPIVMRTHHEAGDDSERIVGRVTAVEVDDSKALRYKAQLYDTAHARDIAALVTPDQPALRSVSIHGYWMGDTRQVQTENGPAMTADDLEIDAIDFTASPGVDGALIDTSGSKKASESGGVLRTPISESSEASLTMVEEGSGWAGVQSWTETRGRQYELDSVTEAKYSSDDMKSLLAKGHAMKNASGEPSYPIADVSDLKKAIRAVGRGGSDHDKIRAHIIKRAKALGQSALIPDNWNSDGSMKESHIRTSKIIEYYPGGDDVAAFCIDAYAGPLSVTLRGCVPPDQLRGAAIAAAQAAMDAINALDPDSDADIDAGLPEEGGTGVASGSVGPDDDMESVTGETKSVQMMISGSLLSERDLRDVITSQMLALSKRYGWNTKETSEAAAVNGVKGKPDAEAAAVNGVKGEPDAEAAAVNGVEGEPAAEEMPPGVHAHSHATGEDSSHTHGHVHTHENAGGGSYEHTHGHTHFHLPGSDEAHVHSHDHDHATAPTDTHESHTEEESAVSETIQAAEAAPNRMHPDDLKALGEMFAEAIRAVGEMKEPKHAATTQETAEKTSEAATETAEKVEEKVASPEDALKESLAKLRKELRNELRDEFLKENGLPPRRGFRLSENAEEEDAGAAAWGDRVELLLGDYAKTPKPAQA